MTPIDVVNQSLDFIGAQVQLASFSDPARPGLAASALLLYTPTVQLVLRQNNPDFARLTPTLLLASTVTPPVPWMFVYEYPADCLFLRQLVPPPRSYNIYDPFPVRGNVGVVIDPSSNPVKVIATDLANAFAVYTTSLVTEDNWDSVFLQAVIRQLANPLAMAVAGRPDYARELLEEAARYEQMQELDDESMARAI
jgi:hypothetical protein